MPVARPSRVVSRGEAPTKKFSSLRWFVFFAVLVAVPAGYFLILSARNPSSETLTSEIQQSEAAIRDNGIMLKKLDVQAARLKSVAGDEQLYRLPVLIQGRSAYVTLTAAEIEEFSRALALEDLLVRHHVTKGHFYSSDDADWKAVLIKASEESREHLKRIELPAVRDRMVEIQQETAKLEARRSSLLQKVAKAGG
jgi:hypothetical protein